MADTRYGGAKLTRLLLFITSALALAVPLSVTSSTAASGVPTDGGTGWTSESADPLGIAAFIATPEQMASVSADELDALNEQIARTEEKVRSAIDDDSRGFAGLAVNPVEQDLTIWWVGDIPPALGEVLAGVPQRVSVRQATHSRAELMGIARSVFFPDKAQPIPNVTTSVRPDGAGIVVSVDPSDVKDHASDEQRAQLVKAAGVPTTWVQAKAPIESSTRQNDRKRGGSGMVLTNDAGKKEFCSTGFAVLDGAYGRLLSAAHCDDTHQANIKTGDSSLFIAGPPHTSIMLAADSMLIDPPDGTVGEVHTGGDEDSTTMPVHGTATNNIGDIVCSGGANSGQHCPLTIIDDSASKTCVTGYSYTCTFVKAQAESGETAVATGDSGG